MNTRRDSLLSTDMILRISGTACRLQRTVFIVLIRGYSCIVVYPLQLYRYIIHEVWAGCSCRFRVRPVCFSDTCPIDVTGAVFSCSLTYRTVTELGTELLTELLRRNVVTTELGP